MNTTDHGDGAPPLTSATTDGLMDNTSHSEYGSCIEEVIAEHRALHRFMKNLLNEASVSALHTFLIQDNASTLTKSASQSAQAAHKRFFLGKDHLITKEISRWESYPFEVDKPIVVNRPKKAKNGCVPQRRAKRRSGLESAGEIKADIAKKAASLPRAPRRRSSVRTDEAQKANMQDELISLFEESDDSSVSSTTQNSGRPRRELSPHRWATPKKPIRRISEVPEDLTAIYHSANANTSHSSVGDLLMDSQHSQASTESTLSEIAARQSDLSSVCENTELLGALSSTFDSRASLNCGVILEDEPTEDPILLPPPPNNPNHNGSGAAVGAPLKRNNSSQSVPRKPMRRVSEIPEYLGDPLSERTSSHSYAMMNSDDSLSSWAEEPELVLPMPPPAPKKPEKLPALERVNTIDLDDIGGERELLPLGGTRRTGGTGEKRMPRKVTSLPSSVSASASPRKPTRRPSEVPHEIIHYMHREKLLDNSNSSNKTTTKFNEAQHSFSTESTTSETTADTLEERPSLNCSVILEEEVGFDFDDPEHDDHEEEQQRLDEDEEDDDRLATQ